VIDDAGIESLECGRAAGQWPAIVSEGFEARVPVSTPGAGREFERYLDQFGR